MALTQSLYEMLFALVHLYESSRRPVRSEELAEYLEKSSGTVRNTIAALKALGLVESRPGPEGGYVPTAKGLECVRRPGALERTLEPTPILIDGRLSRVYALELDLMGLTDPAGVRAIVRVAGPLHQVREGADVRLGPTPKARLIVTGKVARVDHRRREMLLSVESLVAVPRITAEEVMTPNPLVVDEDKPLVEVAGILVEHDIRALPVVDSEGRLRGIVTASHVARAYARRDYNAKVKGYMEKRVPTISPSTDILEVMRILAERRTGRAVVVDGARPVGIVTRTDVLNKLAKLAEL